MKQIDQNGQPVKCLQTKVRAQIWDTAGQERYQSLGTSFYRGADCCFLVYDITNKSSLDNIENWWELFIQKSMIQDPETFPFMVVGNKTDLEDQRVVTEEQAQKFVKDLGNDIEHMETSAKDNTNVNQAFEFI